MSKKYLPQTLVCHECNDQETSREYEEWLLSWTMFCDHNFCSTECAVRWTLKNSDNKAKAESAVGLRT